jgi:ADP-ribose pyrophosphatase
MRRKEYHRAAQCGGYTRAMHQREAKTVWQCPWWRVDEEEFSGPDGKLRRWFSARRPNPETVHILGITPEGLVPVLRQWRYPVGAWVWELPAGLCDKPGEALADTARRELLEETGYSAGEMVHLFRGTVSPGLTNEMYNAFLCLDLTRVHAGGGVSGETIEVHHVPVQELHSFALRAFQRGELIDSKVLAHVALAVPAILALPGRADWWRKLTASSPPAAAL